MKYINIFFLLIFIHFFAFSQKVTITGKVVDSQTGEELPGAKIIVNGGELVTGTNLDGRYSIEMEKKESIKLKVSYIGYKEQEIEIKNIKEEKVQRNIELVAEGTTTEEVIVTDSRYEKKAEEITISVATLKPKQLDAQASTDLLKAMEQTSGITIMKDQPNIRGSAGYTYGSGTRVLTMLDGLPMISADRSNTNFDMLPTDNIKQVEVIKGASSVLFGAGAMGGVINVLTSDPTIVPKSSVRIRHEVFGNPRDKSANWDGRSSAINTSIHAFHARKIKNFDLTTQLDLIRNSGFKQEEFSNRGRVLLMTKYYIPKVEGLYIGLNAQANLDSSATFIAWAGYPGLQLIPGEGFLSYQWLQRYTLDPSVAYLTKKGDRYVYRGRLFHQDNDISTGQSGTATLIYNDFQFIKGLVTAKDSSGFNLTGLAGFSHQRNNVRADSTFGKAFGDQYGAFLQFDIKWGRLNASAGVRYQYEQIEGDKFEFLKDNLGLLDTVKRIGRERLVTMKEPVARLGLNYRIHKATYLRASAGQGLRSPSVAERYTTTAAGGILVLPNPNIKVEKGYTAELGVKQMFKFGDWRGFVDISAFTMQFNNMVEFLFDRERSTLSSFGFSAQNISSASINGLEFNGYIDGKVGNWIFSWGGGLTLIDPINKDGIKTVTYKNANGVDTTEVFDGNDDPNLVIVAGRYIGNPDSLKITNDQPYTLKYRSKTTFRSSLEVGYKQFTAMLNYRYNSHMVNVDKIFGLAIPGALDFRKKHNKGANVVDLILSYQIRKNTVSFHIFNVFNEEYALIPGSMGAQRSYCLQYRWNF